MKITGKMKLVPVELVDFLCGAAPLDGVWYGENPPKGKPRFWWRGYFDTSIRSSKARGGK